MPPERQLRSVSHAQFPEDVAHVFFNGTGRKMKLERNFFIGLGLCHQVGNLSLAERQIRGEGPGLIRRLLLTAGTHQFLGLGAKFLSATATAFW